MRQVLGKATHELDGAGFAALRARYDGLVLDVGTGDGKHVLHVARERPTTLVVGLDASPDAMRRTSHPRRTPANAIFVWAAVEQLPAELTGVSEVHVLMPWGSLLRAVVEPDAEVLTRVARACTPAARFEIVLNLHAWRPPVPEVGATTEPTPESIRTTLGALGWLVERAGYGAPETTSWAKRLGRDALAVSGQVGN